MPFYGAGCAPAEVSQGAAQALIRGAVPPGERQATAPIHVRLVGAAPESVCGQRKGRASVPAKRAPRAGDHSCSASPRHFRRASCRAHPWMNAS